MYKQICLLLNMYLLEPRFHGIHPGILVARTVRNSGLSQRKFALAVGTQPQSWQSMSTGKRPIPTALSLRMDRYFELPLGTVAHLQTAHEVAQFLNKPQPAPSGADVLRKSLFWDTPWERLDWVRHADAIIRRVFSYGNDEEKAFITNHYGAERVALSLESDLRKPYTLYSADFALH